MVDDGERISAGDLSAEIRLAGCNGLGRLTDGLQAMQQSLAETVRQNAASVAQSLREQAEKLDWAVTVFRL